MAVTDFSAFRTLALAYCAVDGSAYIDVTTDSSGNTAFTTVANEVMKRFSEETMCLFSDNIAVTFTGGTGVYSLRGSAFANELLQVQRFYVSGNPIFETTEEDVSRLYPSYLTDGTGKPSVWFTLPPNQVRFYRTPDQNYTNSYASAWYVHPTITAENGAGGTLFFRPEDIRCVAREVAIDILEPRAMGTSLQRLDRLRAQNQAEKEKIKSRALNLFLGPTTRRHGSGVHGLR